MKIRIATFEGGGYLDVEAKFVHPDGLAITPAHPAQSKAGGWVITHVASGYRIGMPMSSLRKARAALKALLPLADWTQPYEAYQGRSDLASKVAAVLAEASAR